jgi:hypothetical protein
MKLSQRLQKLERVVDRTRMLSPMERYTLTVNEAALRLTGGDYESIKTDSARNLVVLEASNWAMRELSDAERAILLEELGLLAYGSKAALEAAKRELDAIL